MKRRNLFQDVTTVLEPHLQSWACMLFNGIMSDPPCHMVTGMHKVCSDCNIIAGRPYQYVNNYLAYSFMEKSWCRRRTEWPDSFVAGNRALVKHSWVVWPLYVSDAHHNVGQMSLLTCLSSMCRQSEICAPGGCICAATWQACATGISRTSEPL